MVLQNRTQQIITAASSSQLREVNDDDDDDRDDNNNDRQHQNDEKPIIFLLVYGVCLSVCVWEAQTKEIDGVTIFCYCWHFIVHQYDYHCYAEYNKI